MTDFYIGGKAFSFGDRIMLNHACGAAGVAPAGTIVELICWNDDHENMVGVYSETPIAAWHELNGEVDMNHGWWLSLDELEMFIDWPGGARRFIVYKDFEYNGIQLKGKECTFHTGIDKTGLSFVEFDENLGGCSADGLGKRGHCIAVPSKFLKEAPKKKASEK